MIRLCSVELQNDEECDTTGDDSSTEADYININLPNEY
jgi:hypothetical protein